MKFFVDENPYEHDRPNVGEEHADDYPRVRMARWLAILLAGVAGGVAWVLAPQVTQLEGVFPVIRDHYPWALLPLTWLALHLAVWGYLSAGEFFEEFSDAPMYIGATLGLVLAVVMTLEWDYQIDLLIDFAKAFPGGIWALGVVFLTVLTVALLLRRTDYSAVDADEFWIAAGYSALLLALAPLIYVVGFAAWTEIPWGTLGDWLSKVPPAYYTMAAALMLIAVQTPGWRRYWGARTGLSQEDEAGSTLRRVILGGVTVAFVAAAVLYQLPELLVDRTDLNAAQYADTITQERRTLLAVMGALGAGVTLVYTHLRHQLDRDANATGRYTEAVQQLGSGSMSIRLGGIYALARVARDSPGDRQTVAEVFAAFVRDGTRQTTSGVDLDVMAALTELGKTEDHRREFDSEWDTVNLRSSNLAGGNLESFRFPSGVDLSESNLSGCRLRATTMHRATLSGANLEEADFMNAALFGCAMTDVRASRGIFADADLSWVRAAGADFANADFRKAQLTGADLERAVMRHTDLTGADLRGADLRGADLTEAKFSDARLDYALLHGAALDDVALIGVTGLETVIRADIRSDRKAQQEYATWRADWADLEWGDKAEYAKNYDPDDPDELWIGPH